MKEPKKFKICPKCNGEGSIAKVIKSVVKYFTCKKCKGTGYISK